MPSYLLSLNPSDTEFLIFGLPQQLSELNNNDIVTFMYLTISYSCLLFLLTIFNKNLSFAQHISAVSKSYFYNIRNLRRFRNTIDQTTA